MSKNNTENEPNEPEIEVQSTPAIPEPEVQSTPAIPEVPAGAILTQENDPLFIALQREKKRTKKLRALLTKNKNLGTSGTADAAGTAPGTEPEPGTEGNPAPVLEPTGNKESKRDPISRALNFLGKGNKKRDGP